MKTVNSTGPKINQLQQAIVQNQSMLPGAP